MVPVLFKPTGHKFIHPTRHLKFIYVARQLPLRLVTACNFTPPRCSIHDITLRQAGAFLRPGGGGVFRPNNVQKLIILLDITLPLCALVSFVQKLEDLGGFYKLNCTGVTRYLSGGGLECSTTILKLFAKTLADRRVR